MREHEDPKFGDEWRRKFFRRLLSLIDDYDYDGSLTMGRLDDL